MLGGAGLKGRGGIPTFVRQRWTALPRSSRSISSFRSQASRFPIRHGGISQTLSGNLSWRPAASISGAMSARFNSTSSASEHASELSSGSTVPDFSDLSAADITSLPEQIGYLKEMGLDYGWGPSSVIEFFIEHFHIWGGLPWWASIVGTGLLIRAALLKPTLSAADTSTKVTNLRPITEPLRQQMMQLGSQGNHAEMYRLRAEMQRIHHDNGVQAWKTFVPMLQIPFGIGCYRVVNGMTSLPIPGLAMESVGWLRDLTVADPYFILPVLSSLCMYLSMRKGGENGVNQLQGSAIGKAFLYGMPGISFLFMAFFPSALQLYFVATGLFGLGQAYLLSSEKFRKSLNIAIPQRNPLAAANGSGPGQDGSQQSKALRTLSERLEAERAKLIQADPKAAESLEVSFIDRTLNSMKETKDNIKREAMNKINEVRGEGPVKNADGSLAEPHRLSEKDRKLADDYERRRKEEEDWKREERNHARREAHLRAMELEREKARSAFKVKQR